MDRTRTLYCRTCEESVRPVPDDRGEDGAGKCPVCGFPFRPEQMEVLERDRDRI